MTLEEMLDILRGRTRMFGTLNECEDKLCEIADYLEMVVKERDAAIEDLRDVLQHGTAGEPLEECWWCKGDCKPTTECRNLSEWKWRGVKEKQNGTD